MSARKRICFLLTQFFRVYFVNKTNRQKVFFLFFLIRNTRRIQTYKMNERQAEKRKKENYTTIM